MTPMSHTVKVTYEFFGVLLIAVWPYPIEAIHHLPFILDVYQVF